MLGYVTCEKAELKVREYELYSAYYCGVCKSIGARYGQLARTVLSYDSVFLSMLLDGVSGKAPGVEEGSCLLHPVKGKNIASSKGIDFAADVMLILAWFNYLDDQNDKDTVSEKSGAGEIAKQAALKVAGRSLKKAYGDIEPKYPGLCEEIAGQLDELSALEKEKCTSLDEAAEPFANIMVRIFEAGFEHMADSSSDQDQAAEADMQVKDADLKVAGSMGYHLGKWIYLMDAWEDLEKDIASGAYNPLIYRFGYGSGNVSDPGSGAMCSETGAETADGFRDRIRESVEFNLMTYLSMIGSAVDLLELKGNKGIIENIVFMGLLRRTEDALKAEEKGIQE